MNVSPAAAQVIYELTNTGQVVNNRGRDLDRRVVDELARLLNMGANASATGTLGGQFFTTCEELDLSDTPSGRAMTTAAVADLAMISDRGVRAALATGQLTGQKVGRAWIVGEAEARRFANERRERAA